MKNGEAKESEPFDAIYGGNVGGNVKKAVNFGALVLLGAGSLLAGCKSAPPLTPAQAQAMIQAKYDQTPGQVFDVAVDDRGMQQGGNAKYWALTKHYANGYWGDFTLTPDGKKVLKLTGGGDVIEWRPEGPNDPHYSIIIVPLSLTRLKARDAGQVETIGDSRTVTYFEDVDLSALPSPLQVIAQNPGNQLSTQRMATFVLNNGAWTLKSVE